MIHYRKNKNKDKESYVSYLKKCKTDECRELVKKREKEEVAIKVFLKKQKEEAEKKKKNQQTQGEKERQKELDLVKKDLLKLQKAYEEKQKIKKLETKLLEQKGKVAELEGKKKKEKENKNVKALSPGELNDLLVSQSSTSFSLYPNGMYRPLNPKNTKAFSDEYHIEDDKLIFKEKNTKKDNVVGILNNLCTKYYLL